MGLWIASLSHTRFGGLLATTMRLVAESATSVAAYEWSNAQNQMRNVIPQPLWLLLPENAPAGGAKTPPLAPAQELFYKALNIKDNRHLSRRHSNAEAATTCVFFAQHIAEIVQLDL